MTPPEALLDLVAPALRSIGTCWELGDLSIADEHRASAVATRLISRLGARFTPRGVKRGSVVLAAPSGELHAAPVAIAANLLRWRGFDVVELGADTPAQAFAETVAAETNLVAAGMACTTDGTDHAARDAISMMRRSSPYVPVLVGGTAIRDASHASNVGADVFTGGRADAVVDTVEEIVAGTR
jgi:methanogenic corrinoid protein MtbC1